MGYAMGHGGSGWQNSPYNNLFVLLGCEVTGQGRPVQDNEHANTHVLNKMDSAIVRYIFLAPGYAPWPTKDQVTQKFDAVFKKIREGKFES
jgi:hypothetical protein